MDNIQKMSDLPIDTRLTRGEVIDLIIEQMEQDLDKKLKDKEEERRKLATVTFNDVSGMIKGTETTTLRFEQNWNAPGRPITGFTVHFSFGVPKSGEFKERAEEHLRIEAEITKLNTMLNETKNNRSKAKNVILKRFLEASPEGKTILEQISNFRMGLQKQLASAIESKKKGA